MGMIAEIALTIGAWKRGWRWLALIPFVVTLITAFLAGLVIGILGGNSQEAMPYFLLLDLACIIALIVMIALAPKKKTQAPPGLPAELD